jgi:LmbE family N-acetylglucosaminyl deacetylase
VISFAPLFPPGRAPRLLCLGAHSDDLEIGCGGTVLELSKRYPEAKVRWVVMSGAGARGQEARASAKALLTGFAKTDVTIAEFRDGFLPQAYGELKEFFESLKKGPQPDLVLTHTLGDRHQDHRLIAELTWNTWRDVAILEYEIPKYEGDLGLPNVFVPLGKVAARRKLEHLLKHFGSQRSRRWFKAETFESHLRLRGIECNAATGYAEAFHGRKILF